MNPKVRWLVIAVKSWAHACGLLSSSDFTTYAVTWLVLFFLMSKKLVPSVASFMFKSRNVPLIQGKFIRFISSACCPSTLFSNLFLSSPSSTLFISLREQRGKKFKLELYYKNFRELLENPENQKSAFLQQ